MTTTLTRKLAAPALAALLALAALPGLTAAASAQTSEIKFVVNKTAVTSYDIQRRAAFLKLQRKSGANAGDEMVDQTLRSQEIARQKVNIPDKQIDDAYARFAAGNKLSPKQMDEILNQSGVTKSHFREFMRVQMGWGQVLQSRGRSQNRMSEQDLVQRMMKEGGRKPSATEYMLQQVIFVVPAAERGSLLGKRKREAESMRARFNGCENTRTFAKGLIDVTVRDLGRVLEPELPPDWEKQIKATSQGGATTVRETERGVEFIGICSSREVSNDRVARMVFGAEDAEGDKSSDALSETYMKELRDQAQIVKR